MENVEWQTNGKGRIFITCKDGSPIFIADTIAPTADIREIRAKVICKAVNCHNDFLNVCKKALKQYKYLLRGSEYYEEEKNLRNVINIAERN